MANVILDNANNVTLTRTSNTRRAISNSGYARIERAGPTFYGLEIDLPILRPADYNGVNNALIDLQDGIEFLSTTLPSKYQITNLQGTIASVSVPLVVGVNNGTSINLDGFTDGDKLLKGDYIQFGNSTKVYQITEDTTSSGTARTIKLNTGLIASTVDDDTVNIGNNVQFKFLLSESPQVNVIPGPVHNLYSYSTINLQEVL